MARATQANALQLLLAAHKRKLIDAPRLGSPGAVRDYRDVLIDWRTIRSYSDHDLMLRTHQVWGQHCLFCWAFYANDPHTPPAYADLEPAHQMREGRQLTAKLDRLVSEMSVLRQEHLRRAGSSTADTPPDASAPVTHPPAALPEGPSAQKPAGDLGTSLSTWTDDELPARLCEYAGMLAAARWMADDRWTWDDPEILNPDTQHPGRSEPD